MKSVLFSAVMAIYALSLPAQETTQRREVLIETTMGNIKVELYNETPLHRDNFLKLAREGYYDGNLFHRVIYNFMIQSGDSTSRHAQPGQELGLYSPEYTIPAEIRFPQIFHKRGVLAAAREGDEVNPEHASSASQFYIVYGRRFNDEMLDEQQARLDNQTQGQVLLTPEVREVYKKTGGTPHLDGQYTVFGEVTEGLNVVKEIDWVPTDDNARPLEDVRIIKMTVL
ncbi:MAG: peptidylprolyl isomerase [Prevotella sp.]|nr:peptidylprolyl isomerase [Prevotella sp.]